MKEIIKEVISNKRYIFITYILFALAASIQSIETGPKTFGDDTIEYSRYNNYLIFKNSFHHLKNNQDLYIAYPNEQWDLYKYTPTFSVFFGFFAVTPDWIGLNLWNLTNALVLLFAIYYLPRLDDLKKGAVLLLVLVELMTSMQNAQSNGLIAGLLVLSFGLLEKEKYLYATLCIVFSFYIKLFGIVGLALLLFYPNKWKLALYTLLWTIALAIIPFLFIDIDQYSSLLQSYMSMLSDDHSSSYGFSVMGWINSWLALDLNKNVVVLMGAVLFLLPFALFSKYVNFTFKQLALCSVLIWIVIFNHKAESPTFIIAMTGVAIWFVTGKKNNIDNVLFGGALILTSLSPTVFFPKFLRDEYVFPYSLKALPCILIWLKILYDMFVSEKDLTIENTIS